MKRLTVLFLLLLTPAAHAQSNRLVTLDAAGTAAVALVTQQQLWVSVGTPGAMPQAVKVAEGPRMTAVAVTPQPDGGARVVWTGSMPDLTAAVPDSGMAVATALVSADGTVGPTTVLEATTYTVYPTAVTDERGDILVAWGGEYSPPIGAAFAPAGKPFTPVTGDVPADAVIALAPAGAGVLVGSACGACPIRVRDLASDVATTLPGSAGKRTLSAGLADDGTAVIGTDAGLYQRAPGANAFTGPRTVEGMVVGAVGAVTGGGALVVGGGTVADVPATGAPVVRSLGTDPAAAYVTAFATDGSATIVAAGQQLFTRTGTAPFAAPLTLTGAFSAGVGRSSAGSIVGWFANAGVLVNGQTVHRDATPPGDVTPPARLKVLAGPVHVRRGKALVPVKCTAGYGECGGSVRARGTRVSVDLISHEGAWLRFPVGRRTGSLRLTVDQNAATTRHVTHRVVHRAPPKRCAPPWADVAARGNGATLRTVLAEGDRIYATTAIACVPGSRRRVLAHVAPDFDEDDILATAINRRYAAIVRRYANHYGDGSYSVTRYDLRAGRATLTRLANYDSDISPLYGIARVVVTSSGAVAVADTVNGHARIRVINVADDHVLDAAPGIDPKSLAVDGATITWTRGGVRQDATP